MYGFGGVGLSEVQNSISELSVVGGWVGRGWVVGGWWTRQTHFMVGPGRGPTKNHFKHYALLKTIKAPPFPPSFTPQPAILVAER